MEQRLMVKWQIRTFALCWIAYACIYFGRVNISVSLPVIQDTFGWSKLQVGLIGSLFFWVYGIGQLINGYLGDKIRARIFVAVGLIVTAISNILFGFATSLIMMMVLWAINGYFQSMLWGPITKTLSYWFPHEQKSRTAISIATSTVAGYLLAWGLSGRILTISNWKWTFWVPGITIIICALIWFLFIKNHPNEIGLESPNKQVNEFYKKNKETDNSLTLWEVICKTKLWFIVIGCLAQGIIKEGIAYWGPTYLHETHHLNIESMAHFIILIPFMNFVGMLTAGWLNKKLKYEEKLTSVILFGIGMVMNIALLTLGSTNLIAGIIFISLSSAMMHGANTLLLGVIPLNYAKYNKASSIAGFLDFCAYLAAGCASASTGFIVDKFNWNGVLLVWIIIAAVGMISVFISWESNDNKKIKFNFRGRNYEKRKSYF